MERRILLAFTLSFLVFVLYLRLFSPPAPQDIPEEMPEASPSVSEPTPQPGEPAAPEPVGPIGEETEEAPRQEADREIRVVVDTPLYTAIAGNVGGRLESVKLKQYKDNSGNPYEMVAAEAAKRLGNHPLDVELADPAQTARVRESRFVVTSESLTLGESEQATLELSWSDGHGLEVVKRLGFDGSTYTIDVDIAVRQRGTELQKRVLYGPGVGNEWATGTYIQPGKGVVQAGGELVLLDADDVKKGGGAAAIGVTAAGVTSHYFAALMLPGGTGYGARLIQDRLEPTGQNEKPRDVITAALEVPTGPARFSLFLGPKEHDLLKRLGPDMERVIEYGPWMRYLAEPLRSALLWIHGFVGNYGWSIVILTVLINVALIPLKHHSYVSMRKMQKLAPQIKRIQDRYKKLKPTDPRQQEKNKEIYGLYREHHVSPMSGCLPMLLMIPFFFAFYRLLVVSIELRQAPFGLWIHDLSTYDPYFVLPILMGVTQIAIQKMSPQTAADPVQAKIMMFMPVMFMFILAWAPAGLVLYWFVNNLVSIAQQTITNRLVPNEGPDGMAGNRKARLEAKA